MSDLEPITRAENFWVNEGDLEPITRKEQYIKHLYDETQVVPEYPKTREEYFINKAGEELHDVTVEQLKVTENGTYSEEGKAFSPVIVNVQPDLITKSITANGTYNASADNADGYSSVNVNVEGYKITDVSGLPSAIATFSDGANLPMPSLKVGIEPVQDLHGYDAPWVGGAGKNKLPMTVDGIKSVNTYHSWSGNSTTINNVTIIIETDSVGNVTGIKFNGTASADITFNLASNITIPNGSYVWSNDQIVNISNLWLSLTSPNIAITLSTQKEVNVTVSSDSIGSAYIYASSGNVFNNVVFKPMIRLASEQDATFTPYSNICPISGWSAVDVTIQDDIDNPTVTHTTTIPFYDSQGNPITVYGGELDVVNGIIKPNIEYDSYNGETLVGRWISDRDKYAEGATPTTGAQVVDFGAYDSDITTQPTSIKSLNGQNNLSANTGDVVEASYFESL